MSGPDGQPGTEPEYAPPVDPWAAAEAEHRAALEAERQAALMESADHPTPDHFPTATAPMETEPVHAAAQQVTPAQRVPTEIALIDSDSVDTAAPGTFPAEAGLSRPAAAAGGRGLAAYRRVILWGAAIVTVVVAVSAAALVFWWPRDGAALDFRALRDVRTLPAAESASFLATRVTGDRTYLASAPTDGTLVVSAVHTATGAEIWRSEAAGDAATWKHIIGVPGEDTVVAIGKPDSSDSALRMVVLGGHKGTLQWERPLGADDKVLFIGGTVVVAEQEDAQVVGLDLHKGTTRWDNPTPKDTSGGTATALVAATTAADLAAPADAAGVAFAPATEDERFVQIGADRSAQVFEAASGKLVTRRPNVAEPADIVVAHDDTLFVASAQHGYQIVRYDLGDLGQPALVYAASDSRRQLTRVTPCDTDRLCLVDTVGYDATTADVVAVDVGGKGQLWRVPVPDAETLVPVGASVLVGRNTSPDTVRLLDGKGATSWDSPGAAVRLDRGNLLLFAKPLPDNASDVSVAGRHLGDEPVQLGPMTGAVTSSCSWNAEIIACAADDGFVLRRFVG
ncbi:MAG TPA: PQQ-binding-like beta-propeller repeat protein [Actinoplanes sp.]|nr:PQQ-binding-like beta-propeller repeat protein [Actinoplanes sp.]